MGATDGARACCTARASGWLHGRFRLRAKLVCSRAGHLALASDDSAAAAAIRWSDSRWLMGYLPGGGRSRLETRQVQLAQRGGGRRGGNLGSQMARCGGRPAAAQ